MSFTHVNGIRLHYERTGSGPDVVVVHGLGANLAFWYLCIAPSLAGNFSVLAYDLRGHGRSDMPLSGYDRLTMCADLAALVDQFNIPHFHLIGHSFGGLVALEYASSHPERVLSLTLADVTVHHSRGDDRLFELDRWKIMRKRLGQEGLSIPIQMPEGGFPLLQELATQGLERSRQGSSAPRLPVPFGLWNGSSESAGRWLQLLRATSALSEFDIPDTDSLQYMPEFTQPILLIFGEQSRWIEGGRILSNILPNCRTVIIPKAGHFHPLQCPRQFAKHVSNFLLGDRAA
jgi:pimeloyl-ACP methyl ester carboxylesterase